MKTALQNLASNMDTVARLLLKFGRKDKYLEVQGAKNILETWIKDI